MELYSKILTDSPGSSEPRTGIKGIPQCVNEVEIGGPNRGNRFICIAMLDKNFQYLPCKSSPAGCPAKAFQAKRTGNELVVVKNS